SICNLPNLCEVPTRGGEAQAVAALSARALRHERPSNHSNRRGAKGVFTHGGEGRRKFGGHRSVAAQKSRTSSSSSLPGGEIRGKDRKPAYNETGIGKVRVCAPKCA